MKRSSEEFARIMREQRAAQGPFTPSAYYDSDGDCIELLLSDEPYKRDRLDKWVTVFYSRNSGEVVGAVIKSIGELMTRYPGLDIDIDGGRVRIALMLRGPAYSTGDPVTKARYKDLITKAADLEVVLQTA